MKTFLKYVAAVFGILVAIAAITLAVQLGNRPEYSPGECVKDGDSNLYQIMKSGKFNTYIMRNLGATEYLWSTNIDGGLTRVDCMGVFDESK